MQRDVWARCVRLVQRFATPSPNRRYCFSEADILLVYFWANEQGRPIYWACDPAHWPDALRPARLPSAATMSRRLRGPAVTARIEAIRRHLQRGQRRGLCSLLDGKVLRVGPYSHDPDARVGYDAGGWAKGYKFHLICNGSLRIEAWSVQPLNVDERVVARQLLPRGRIRGYLLADRNYDDGGLHEICARHGVQLVAPRRKGPHKGLGHRPQSPARRRCIDLLEHSHTGFGPRLHRQRADVERRLGALSSAWYGIGPLPPWVRGQECTERWVAARLVLFHLHHTARKRRR
jgi:hypothetical protein